MVAAATEEEDEKEAAAANMAAAPVGATESGCADGIFITSADAVAAFARAAANAPTGRALWCCCASSNRCCSGDECERNETALPDRG